MSADWKYNKAALKYLQARSKDSKTTTDTDYNYEAVFHLNREKKKHCGP